MIAKAAIDDDMMLGTAQNLGTHLPAASKTPGDSAVLAQYSSECIRR